MGLEWNCTNCGAVTFRTEYCDRCDPSPPDEPGEPAWWDFVGRVVQRAWVEQDEALAEEKAAHAKTRAALDEARRDMCDRYCGDCGDCTPEPTDTPKGGA